MNRPPDSFQRVAADALRTFFSAVFAKAGMPGDKAAFFAGLLVTNDLRGVFSHGTRQVTHYTGDVDG